jgi:hypothetical protein
MTAKNLEKLTESITKSIYDDISYVLEKTVESFKNNDVPKAVGLSALLLALQAVSLDVLCYAANEVIKGEKLIDKYISTLQKDLKERLSH